MTTKPLTTTNTDDDSTLPSAPPAQETRPLSERERKAAERRTMILSGPLHKTVFAVALPSVATMLLQTTNGMLDGFFVGTLGPDALAAITVSSSLMFGLMSFAMAISVGTTALVARFVGENNTADAITATKQSLILSVWMAAFVGVPIYFLRFLLLTALGLKGDALPLAADYLGITILGLPSLFLLLIANGAFRGLGDTMRPFWVSLFGNILHIGFNYLLIFGALGFPRMGLPGGALALVISQVVQTVLYFVYLRQTPLAPLLSGPWPLLPDLLWATRIGRIGIPSSVQQFARVGSMILFQGMLASTGAGSAAIAALGLGLRSESIAFMPGFGYSIAASAFVGQNLGAKQPDRAEQGAWSATWQAVGIMTIMGILFATFAEPFAHLFLRHGAAETAQQSQAVEETIQLTAAYLQIALWSEPFLAFGMVLNGALQGAGDTFSATLITVATMFVFRLVLAYLVLNVFGFGVIGAWWAMSLSTIVAGIATIILFRQGNWRKVIV